MDVFDIIGPVMIGPSSSHTAGAVRIGKMVRGLLGEEPKDVIVKLHGSFAHTYRGHGTDKAIIAGLMDMSPDDLRIRDSLKLANELGICYRIETVDIKDAHPNTALIEAKGISGNEIKVMGASIGGGNIVIKQINGLEVEFSGQYNTLIILHNDAPGTIGAVTNLLGSFDINIAQMRDFRTHRGGIAIMVLETDQQVSEELKSLIDRMPRVINVRKIIPV